MNARLNPAGGSWLCPSELDRTRLVDISRRSLPLVAPAVVAGTVFWIVLAVRIGPIVLTTLIGAALCVIPMALLSRVRQPEWLLLGGDVGAIVSLAAAVALTGGAHSPLMVFCITLPVTAATRYNRRGSVLIVAIASAAMLAAAAFGIDRGDVADDLWLPAILVCMIALTATMIMLAGVEKDHRERSMLDPLTGLLNRLAFERRFAELAVLAHVSGGELCLAVGDLDRFKAINDEHGHATGDAVLREVAYAMRTNTRSFSLLYRIGGEEFVVLLPGTALGEASEVVERLRAGIAASRPAGLDVTISFGVVSASGAAVDLERMFEAADQRLYAAKRRGRNCVVAIDDAARVPQPAQLHPERRAAA